MEKEDEKKRVTNLKTLCGDRFVVVDDGTDAPDPEERVWCQEIRGCRAGIYLCGFDGALAVYAESERMVKQLRALLGLKLWRPGLDPDAGENPQTCGVFRFPPDLALVCKVAEIIKAKKRRRLSPEAKAALLARLREGKRRGMVVLSPEESPILDPGAPKTAQTSQGGRK